ncbi:serine/threonine-protein kinase prp4 isoform X2 [Capsella rubella]|uniref:serine/threonine-protein kinase prp4 isoform X2 n=1 Tax=Capsella rubella TaxID=81985 RepID=UPI000CD49F94|nr:serine/threonine-protein kinase prp4 isoform X2 [Capsella rubella]
MVSDKHVESNHRKHRRSSSSSDEVIQSSKRHNHRHDHKHRHSHHRDEDVQYGDEEHVSTDFEDHTIVGNGGELDIQEGEISKKRLERGLGSNDRDIRRERDRDNDRGRSRSRDKCRHTSRETGRENERESRREKYRDRGRIELESDRDKLKILDDGYKEVRKKQPRHDAKFDLEIRISRHDHAEDDLKIRSFDSVKDHNPSDGNIEETRENVERSKTDVDVDDNGENLVWGFDQEAEDLKIIEKSRRKTQSVLEKRKKKLEEEPSTVADVLGSATLGPVSSAARTGIDAVDGEVAKLSSAVKEEPRARLVISDLDKTLASVGFEGGSPKSDMFSDDIFGESPAPGTRKGNGLHPFVRSGLHDNWDDAEGYYSYQLGELLDGRYEIMATHGKGVFSTVVRAKDTKAAESGPEEVAIKVIRNNETMHKAGKAEIRILNKLAGSDPENKHHCVRLLSSFKYRNHLCLVFESLHLNLREIVKKSGVNVGLQLSDIRVYAKQLFTSLKHLKNCGVLHCDIKPANILVNEGRNMLKLCDFGSAMFAGENQVTPYLASRFYRAPEIILGLSYDHPLDMWSVGCCLYELYSGKIMFPGSTNNDMLRLHMELKGPFPKKMLRKGAFIDQHFDQDLCFYATEEDSVTGKTIRRMMVNIKPNDLGSVIKRRYKDEDPKVSVHFRNLLDKIFTLDPQKRLTVSQALAHPFITGK